MFLSLYRFVEYQLSHVILRFLRFTLITIGTSSAIYIIKFLPKLREKEFVLEKCIKHRLTLETQIVDRTTNNEQLKKQINDLYMDSKQLYDVYIELESEENQLSNTIQKLIDNQYLLHHSLPMDKNEKEFFSSTLGDNYSFNSNIITTTKVSQSCLSSHLFNEVDSMIIRETLQTNSTLLNSINEQQNNRSKKKFSPFLWLKKKKYNHSQGDGDT